MGLLNDNIKSQVQQALSGLQEPVHLVVFTQGEGGAIECTMCSETRQLAEEVAELSDKINLTVYDFVKDAEVAEQYGVDKIPALVIARGGQNPKDYGVRFFGIPSGYEFSSLIEDIRLVSQGQAGLSPKTLLDLEKIKEPVHIQVFVTPT